MKENRFAHDSAPAPEAAADESASPVNPHRDGYFSPPPEKQGAPPDGKVTVPPEAPPDPPDFETPPLLSDGLAVSQAELIDNTLDEALAETFPPGSRKPRHDGWTPEIVEGFLRHLAATGVVDHAARAVKRSVASAYAFRNRRQGRAFARMWDAVLVHRARARVAGELQGRAIAGCVSVRKKDGVVVSEYHYYDNRLAMSLLTRLDRLAEREAASEAHLRTLSEDLDDYCDCIAEGGDADAFVEARKPVPSQVEGPAGPEPAPAPGEERPAAKRDGDPELTTFARLAGCSDYLDVAATEIEVRDLDPADKSAWSPDQWVRAYRSGFMVWLHLLEQDPGFVPGPGAPLSFLIQREAAAAAREANGDSLERASEAAAIDIPDLDPAHIWDWTDDQLARAWNSGLLKRLPHDFWDDLVAREVDDGEEE